jgi:hypothetical protein
MPSAASLTKKIQEITANNAGEPDLYGYVRDLLTRSTFGIGLQDRQVVVDSKLDGSLRRPDLVVYRTEGNKALRGPNHAIAVFEVKKDDLVQAAPMPILREKRGYVQAGTEWFFLIDQTVVVRLDVTDRRVFEAALAPRLALPPSIAKTWSWADLANPDHFDACFGVLSAEHLTLEAELLRFRRNETAFSFIPVEPETRSQFSDTIREASELLREAVGEIIATKGIADLKTATTLIEPMQADYGAAKFDWTDERRPISFERINSRREREALDETLIVDYERRRQELLAELHPVLYALRLEHDLFQQYAERQGVAEASLLKVETDPSKPNARLLQSLAYETGSLILSRMLTIRFCEDYGLFKVRYISNGGIEVFWRFAEHFDLPMQELMRQTYRHAQGVFRSIFDANLLDWVIARNDPILSKALERAAYILSRWNFRTVEGDVLSGVYDQYLDVAQRRRLGEVYTRPEVARFMLEAAGWSGNDDILDPACGTGTFLVEALVQRLQQLSSAGAVNAGNVRAVVARLHGLDISSFSIALAQIQIFWHLIDVVRNKTVEETREFARAILPSLPLHGGWSSLDPMGRAFGQGVNAGAAAQRGLTFRLANAERGGGALIPPGFEKVSQGEYDLVVMNPPYIRSERTGAGGVGDAYAEVAFKNTDTSIYFIYRALRQWVKPGGRLAFIVPIGMSEAAYAGPLRRILEGYRIKLVADLEGLGKATFRGVKRATIIMVVERAAPSPEDEVEMLQLGPTTLVNDVIDFTRAVRTTVRRRQLDRLAYLPTALRPAIAVPAGGDVASTATVNEALAASSLPLPPWVAALRANEDSADALLTKFGAGDPEALASMSELPRLGDIVRVVWAKRDRGRIVDVQAQEPTVERYSYRPELLFNYGVKLGGGGAFCRAGETDCIDLYKGQNIFPQGLLGEPMGRWSPSARRESTRYIYSYSDQLTYRNTFALREISQLPTAAPILAGSGFQNTAHVVELIEPFPLNSYLLSRVVQFYAARVLRSSIIEDLGCHWYKRTLTLLPIPPNRTQESLDNLRKAGTAVMDADSDIADRYREIDLLISAGTDDRRTINRLIVEGDALVAGIDLNNVSERPVPVLHIRETGEEVNSSDLFFRLKVPNAVLRAFVAFQLARKVEDDPEADLCRDNVLEMVVPKNLDEVVAAVRSLTTDDLDARYHIALDDLDRIVAEQCGIASEHRDHMIEAMKTDPLLSQMRPMIAQRGLRVQLYADHSEGNRYG